MAVVSGSASKKSESGKEKIKSPQKKEIKSQKSSGPVENVVISSPSKRNKSPGVRLMGGRIYDSVNGKTCHQCRQKTRDFVAACTIQRSNKPCPIMFCHKCLLNRYGEKAEEVSALGEWSCPRCRGICNCSICMKKRGHQPTGILVTTAKATGFSSVSEMLLKGVGQFTNMVASPSKEAAVSPRKRGKENSFDGKVDANLPNPIGMKSKEVKVVKYGNKDNDASLKRIGPDKGKTMQEQSEETHHHKGNIDILTRENGSSACDKKTKKTKRNRSDGMLNRTDDNVNLEENGVHNDVKKLKTARDGLAEKEYSNKNDFNLARRTSPRKLDVINNKSKKRQSCNARDDLKEIVNGTIIVTKDGGGNGKRRKEKESKATNNKDVLKPQNEDFHIEIPLPMGSDLLSVAGIDVCAEDVGEALQFLEFCAVFAKILEVKKGQPESILRDLLHGRTGRHRKFSATVQFCIQLISDIQTDRGEYETLSPSNGKNSWFHALKKYLSESRGGHKVHGLDSLDNASDYETLATSKRLKLLNFLCDEVLGTQKIRNWIDDQNRRHAEKVKEARQLVTEAKDMEKSLKQKMQDDIAKAIIINNSSCLSISEHEAIVYRIKAEAAQAHAKVLKPMGMMNNNKKSDAVRIEPIYKGHGGHAYWKLNCIGKSDVLHQNIGNGESLNFDDKWFVIDAEGKEVIEKHILSLRGRRIRASRG
ncbi:uncharacterized protein [Primulina eburnea]|uniref:uncharacterized protein n=1 Tax=Primulina eburnea TaxID=1245227 RepID=UPI003C6C6272